MKYLSELVDAVRALWIPLTMSLTGALDYSNLYTKFETGVTLQRQPQVSNTGAI